MSVFIKLKYLILGLFLLLFYVGCGSASAPSTPAQIPTEVEYASFDLTMEAIQSASSNIALFKAGQATCDPGDSARALEDWNATLYCFTPVRYVVPISKIELARCVESEGSTVEVPCSLIEAEGGYYLAGTDQTQESAIFTPLWDVRTTTADTVTLRASDDSALQYRFINLEDGEEDVPAPEEVTEVGGYSGSRFTSHSMIYTLPEDGLLGEMSGGHIQTALAPYACFDFTDVADQTTYSLKSGCQKGDILFDPAPSDGVFHWFDRDTNELSATRPDNPLVKSSLANEQFPLDYDPDGASYGSVVNSADDPVVDIILGGTYSASYRFNIIGSFEFIDLNSDGIFDFGDKITQEGPIATFTLQ